jgi:inorganic pyrophosphatase
MDYLSLPTFGSRNAVHLVVESPRGSTVKLKYDPDLRAFALGRPLPDGLTYPYDWGFVPSTRAADGDPLDGLIVWDRPSYPGVVLACRLIGVLRVEQNSKDRPGHRERNDRLIALPLDAPHHGSIESVQDLPRRVRDEIEAFFAASTAFEKKGLEFRGWSGVKAAYDLVEASIGAGASAPR